MKKNNKLDYFFSIIKNGYIIIALFITTLSLTVLCYGYNQNAFELIKSNKSLFLFLTISFTYFTLLSVLYMFFSTKKKHLSLADSLAFSYLFTGLLYALFLIIIAKDFNIYRLIFCTVLIIIGFIFSLLYKLSFSLGVKVKKIYYTNHSLSGYYSTLFKDFSFFGILLASFAFCCFAFLFSEVNYLQSLQDKRFFFVVFICLFPFIIYYSTSLSSKKITTFDAYLLAQFISMPVIILHAILINNAQPTKLIACIIGIVIILISSIFRYCLFDLSIPTFNTVNTNSDWKTLNYLKRLFSKYNPLLMLTIGGLITIVSLLTLFRLSNFSKVVSFNEGTLIFSLKALPFFFVNLVIYGTLIAFGIISLVNIKSYDITSGDFTLATLIAFTFFASISLLIVPSIWVMLEIIIGTSFSFAILGARVRNLTN